MKYFLFCLFCTIPVLSSAQSWNMIVGGGGIWNSKSSADIRNEYGSPLKGTAGLGVSYWSERDWEFGLRGSYRQYAFTTEGIFYFEGSFDPVTGYFKGPPTHIKFVSEMPAWAVSTFVNRHFGRGRMDYYAGLSPAYLRFTGPKVNNSAGNYAGRLNGANGYGLDIQGGTAYRLSSSFLLFAEGTGGMINIPSFRQRAYVLTASLVLGIKLGIN